MIDKLKEAEKKYTELEAELSDSEIMADVSRYTSIMKEYKNMSPLIEKYREYKSCESDMEGAKEILETSDDPDFKAMAHDELAGCRERLGEIEKELKIMLLPADPNDDKNVIVEIRAGAGGDEAAIFAGDLYRMYSMYSISKKFSVEVTYMNESMKGGYKEIDFVVTGEGAYSRFKFESGVHRVQRVPETESSGRIHTSTATVAVLPEEEDVEIELNENEVQVDTIKSSGAGGQHINKTESAIRLTHIPTGIVIECQDERSQLKNKNKAFKILKNKLYNLKLEEQHEKTASERKSQVGSGDRSEKIRTYNFPQDRLTDHRIGLTVHSLDKRMNGDLDEVIDALNIADTAARLNESEI